MGDFIDDRRERRLVEERRSVQEKYDQLCDMINHLNDEKQTLVSEIERLRAGNWTKEEIHNICHNLHGTVSAEEFAAGCAEEQRRLYGRAPDADCVAKHKKFFAFCKKCGRLADMRDNSYWCVRCEKHCEVVFK